METSLLISEYPSSEGIRLCGLMRVRGELLGLRLLPLPFLLGEGVVNLHIQPPSLRASTVLMFKSS